MPAVLSSLLENPRIRRIQNDAQTCYAAEDVVALLSDSKFPADYWRDLQRSEANLARYVDRLELSDGSGDVLEAVDLEGVLRIAQSISSPAAHKLQGWLIQSGLRQLNDWADPTLQWVDVQKQYRHRGYSNAWVQNRLRGMSTRRELVREWSRRGVKDSEDYRRLTNALFQGAFGMDVQAYRASKFLTRPSDNLRDHMTDLELTLTLLGETTALAFHRAHESQGVDALLADVEEAGAVTRHAREEIDQRSITPRAA